MWTVDEWGAPLESDNNPDSTTKKGDVWYLGIVTLELAFRRFKVTNRKELLAFIRWVKSMRRLSGRDEVAWGNAPIEIVPDDPRWKIF